MKFHFQNIGSIKEAQFELGDLNIVCGKNNTGKTYLTYTLWQILSKTPDILNEYKGGWPNGTSTNPLGIPEKEDILKAWAILGKEHADILYQTFSSKKDYFQQSRILITENPYPEEFQYIFDNVSEMSGMSDYPLSHEDIIVESYKHYLAAKIQDEFRHGLKSEPNRPFLLTAQRDSIELFYKELDRYRSHLVNEAIKSGDRFKSFEKHIARFPLPIQENIDFARDLTSQVIKSESFLARQRPELLTEIEGMLGVKYVADEAQVSVKSKATGMEIPAFMASTSVRSLLHLHFWLKHQAEEGDLLMIDEPELNLHPENQIKMARLFVKLVNVGIKVWITTHSDYIVKEVNNCLMLSKELERKAEMMEEFGYTENDILRQEQLKAYMTVYDSQSQGNVLKEVEFDGYGMLMLTFDEQIEQINHVSEELANALKSHNPVEND